MRSTSASRLRSRSGPRAGGAWNGKSLAHAPKKARVPHAWEAATSASRRACPFRAPGGPLRPRVVEERAQRRGGEAIRGPRLDLSHDPLDERRAGIGRAGRARHRPAHVEQRDPLERPRGRSPPSAAATSRPASRIWPSTSPTSRASPRGWRRRRPRRAAPLPGRRRARAPGWPRPPGSPRAVPGAAGAAPGRNVEAYWNT